MPLAMESNIPPHKCKDFVKNEAYTWFFYPSVYWSRCLSPCHAKKIRIAIHLWKKTKKRLSWLWSTIWFLHILIHGQYEGGPWVSCMKSNAHDVQELWLVSQQRYKQWHCGIFSRSLKKHTNGGHGVGKLGFHIPKLNLIVMVL